MDEGQTQRLVELDHAHLWHPFTPMRQWREAEPLVIESAEGDELIDTDGRRYIDGVSSLWCNVHGHRVPELDQAIRDQLGRVAHTTLLGLGSVPAIELAARLCRLAPPGLNKVFYSDAGATATEVAFKMAAGYWYHRGVPQRSIFVALQGAYHGDTTGAMSVGYSDLFHRPFR
ncbi:MAG: aminotransferase class III-fold pyridoxal phosphate-dependent enzyme, partial [Phycisphaerae bacterium]|nr:aminotransferase class III-fold pyridoxal phosphate-dependent enzyme [Phycisphaerae bacterium]